MKEQPEKTCYQDAELDDGLKIRAAAEPACQSNLSSAPETPELPESDEQLCCTAHLQSVDKTEASASASEGPAAESSLSQNEELYILRQLPPDSKFNHQKEPYWGLLRHRLIVAACFSFAAAILAMSTVDLKLLIARAGILDKSGQIQIPAPSAELPPNLSYLQTYNENHELSEGLRPVIEATWDGNRIGYVDAAGKLLIKTRFSSVNDFHEGRAAVQLAKAHAKTATPGVAEEPQLTGYIDKSGKFAIKPQFDAATGFHDGVAAVHVKESISVGYGALIDRNGRILIQSKGSSAPTELGQVYAMQSSGKYGLVDKKGQWIVAAQFDKIQQFNDYRYNGSYNGLVSEPADARADRYSKYFLAWQNGRCGVIDNSGKIVIPMKFEQIVAFNKGVAVISEDNRYGFADASGKVFIEPRFSDVTAFDDLIAVRDENFQWSVLDPQGKTVKTAAFDAPLTEKNGEWFSEGLAPVFIKGKIGFLNNKGELVIKPRLAIVSAFSDGYAAAWDGSAWGFIDKTGNFISTKRFESVSSFYKGKAQVSVPGPLFFFAQTKLIDDIKGRIKSMRTEMEPVNKANKEVLESVD